MAEATGYNRVVSAEKRTKGGAPHELTVQLRAGGDQAKAARAVIVHALKCAEGRPQEAAEILRISYETLRRLIQSDARLETEAVLVRREARARRAAEKKTHGKLTDFQRIRAA